MAKCRVWGICHVSAGTAENSPGAVNVLHPRRGESLYFYTGIIPEESRAWLLCLLVPCGCSFYKAEGLLGTRPSVGIFGVKPPLCSVWIYDEQESTSQKNPTLG